MLAETLQERDELKIEEGRQEGQRLLLCSQASQRFGEAAGAELSGILASVSDGAELARVGALIHRLRHQSRLPLPRTASLATPQSASRYPPGAHPLDPAEATVAKRRWRHAKNAQELTRKRCCNAAERC